jgi:hypothetical protein
MSAATVSLGRAAADAAVGAAWAQWSALGTAAVSTGTPHPWAIVDPEALVLASVVFGDHERRLPDVAAGWALKGSRLLSMRRLRTLASAYPAHAGEITRFVAGSLEAPKSGGGRSAGKEEASGIRPKPGGPLRLDAGAALMLRLRAAFGVGAKADLLTCLLGLRGAPATLRAIAAATAYTTRAVRTAAEEMELAGIVEEIPGPPVEYRAAHDAWARLLDLRRPGAPRGAPAEMPRWRAWSAVYPFLAHVGEWEAQAEAGSWSDYVASSRARDVVEVHAAGLRRAGIQVPLKRSRRGAGFLDDLEDLVERVAAWTAEEG